MFPKLVSIGKFFIPTYGTLVALAFLIALWVTIRLARRAKLPPEPVTNLAIYCALAGLAGAKLFMILFDWRSYWNDPASLFSLSTLQAAGVYQGGFLVALITAVLYMRHNRLPVLDTCDVFSPGIALGQAIGRLGCFSAGCCWGVECHLPWAVTFTNPVSNQLVGVPLRVPLHPTQLYESFAEFVIFAILYRRIGRPHQTGSIISLYLILYAAARFTVEFFRFHEQGNLWGGPLDTSQWVSIVLFLLGASYFASIRRPEVPAAAHT